MKTQMLTASLFALVAGPAFAAGHAMVSGYALSENGAQLVVMDDIATPKAARMIALSSPLRAIAWRPVTGELLGFADGMISVIDPQTGALRDLDATFMKDAMITPDKRVALDFNNKIDAVRAVSSGGDNLVYFPEGFGQSDARAGSVRRFGDLAYGPSDEMAGTTPMVFANAYSNAINGQKAGGTFQYALDAATDSLISLDNNAGTLATIAKVRVAGVPVDLAPMGGFDIVSPNEGTDMAFAVLQLEGAATAGLYELDLSTGAARMMADLGMGGITGFAVSLGM